MVRQPHSCELLVDEPGVGDRGPERDGCAVGAPHRVGQVLQDLPDGLTDLFLGVDVDADLDLPLARLRRDGGRLAQTLAGDPIGQRILDSLLARARLGH